MSDRLQNQKIVIAGGSGFIGLSLARHLAERGASVVILSRQPPRIKGPWRHTRWDGRTLGNWSDELNGAAGLVNLAGRNVACIKTPDHQDEILRSRVESTRVMGEALRAIKRPPPIWVQMSTAHIYGDPPQHVCAEDAALGYGLAPFVGKAWEEAFHAARLPEQRAVTLRTSFVLGRNRGAGGGALGTLAWLARIGLGGRVGSGLQGMSWIHEADLNHIIEQSLWKGDMHGIYIASAPHPESQVQFMRELRRAVRMPIGLPAFAWMARVGAHYILRTDPELALYGRYVIPQRLQAEGFVFRFPTLRAAFEDLFGTKAFAQPS